MAKLGDPDAAFKSYVNPSSQVEVAVVQLSLVRITHSVCHLCLEHIRWSVLLLTCPHLIRTCKKENCLSSNAFLELGDKRHGSSSRNSNLFLFIPSSIIYCIGWNPPPLSVQILSTITRFPELGWPIYLLVNWET